MPADTRKDGIAPSRLVLCYNQCMKHLFLEGPIQTGKSTLLRRCLAPYRDRLGGFSSQRLVRPGEPPAAYRITEADDFCLQREPDLTLPGIFQIRTPHGAEKHPEVFAEYGVSLLERAAGRDLILLDEIGGSELLVPEFHRALYRLLAGSTPCIGVVKLNEKARSMSRTAGWPNTVSAANRELRTAIRERFDGEILLFDPRRDPAAAERAERIIKEFLSYVGNV